MNLFFLDLRSAKQSAQPVHEFAEVDGQPVLRYAAARRMQMSCLQCHNSHPDTPKNDWKEGDVRGVLALTRPLKNDIARTHRGLRGAVALMTSVCMGTVALILTANFVHRRVRSQR